jgi:threonine/homoserine/homoserine lactone efflux protein
MTLILSFLFAITLLTLTPGFDTALVLRSAAVQGRQRAWATAFGVTLGCLVWGGGNAVLVGSSQYFAAHLRRPAVLKVMDRLTGCVFIGFAAKLALSRH